MASELGAEKLLAESAQIFEIFLYNLISVVLGAVLTPLSREIAEDLNTRFPNLQLSPDAAADMVVRSVMSEREAIVEAARSGLDEARMRQLIANAGEPPGLEFLLQAWRRGFIPDRGRNPGATTLEQGVAESRLKTKWFSVIEQMALVPIPPADAVDAVVKGQIPQEEGERFAYFSGVSKEDFQILFNTRGNPPSPSELAELLRRGFIPLEGVGPDQVSFQQGIYEGATKNKWWRLFSRLADYIPPPRTVTAMVREGALSDAEALALFKQSGLSDHLAASYLAAAHHQKLTPVKELARGDIEQLYRDKVISHKDATTMLLAHGYSEQSAGYILAVQDLHRDVQALNQAIGRIHNLYVAHKIDKAAALAGLNSLHVPSEQSDQLFADWDVERTSNVRLLTSAEIASAFFYKVITQDMAQAELEAQGWTPLDAWIILSVRVHHPLPNQPAPGPALPRG